MNSSFRTRLTSQNRALPVIIGILVFGGIQYVVGQETTSRQTQAMPNLPNLVNPQLLDGTDEASRSRRAYLVSLSDSISEQPVDAPTPIAEMPALVSPRNLLKNYAEPLNTPPPMPGASPNANFNDIWDDSQPIWTGERISLTPQAQSQEPYSPELRGPLPNNLFGRAVAKDPLLFNLQGAPAVNSPLAFQQSTKLWISPNSKWRPLYFEEANIERYGNHFGITQPFRSSVHFFGSAVFLPYQLATKPPFCCEYGLGHLRPGNCVPGFRDSPNVNAKGVMAQGLTSAGLAFSF